MVRKWRAEGLPAVVLALTLLGALAVLVPVRMDMVLSGDGSIYTTMVEHPGKPVGGHFHRYRILGPLIVRWLPWDVDTGFRVLTFSSSFVASLLCYGIGRELGLSAARALPIVPMYLLTWPTVANVFQYRLVDPLAWVFVAAALLLLLKGRPHAACLVAGIGVLAKETVILILPLSVWVYWRSGRTHRAGRLLGVLAISLIPYAVVRMVIPGEVAAGSALRPTLDYLIDRWTEQWREVGPLYTLFYTFAPFGVLWFLLPLGFLRLAPPAREMLGGWLLITVPALLNGSPERMLEVHAPAILPPASLALSSARPPLAILVVIANGLFILRIAATALPYAIAWTSLLVAALGVGWIWCTTVRYGTGIR